MTKNPTFSIVTPSFNQGDFIARTIESIWSQAGDFKIQHIIADGGSKDQTVEVIKDFASRLKAGQYQIKCQGIELEWWSRPDKGQSDAINQGFAAAKGDYVNWLNSDDIYYPEAFAEIAAAFARYPKVGAVYSNWVDIDPADRELKRNKVIPFDLNFEINTGNIIPQPTFFMRKAALDQAGHLNPKYHFALDYDLFIRIGQKYPIEYIKSGWWAGFRLHEASKTVSLADKFWPEERAISRHYGGKWFSPMLVSRLQRKYPKLIRPSLAGLFLKSIRANDMFSKGEYRLISQKLISNVRRISSRSKR